jgi:tetratricopeptide (TPR) repeat protein
MRRTFATILACFISITVASSQVTFSEKRQRDRTYFEGISRILRQEYELASSSFTDCIGIDSSYAPAYLQRGRILIEWGALEGALKDLDRALECDPSLGEACFYKGIILFGMDTTGTDGILFDQALSKGFEDPWAYYYRGLIRIREGDGEAAISDFSKAINLKPDFALAFHERAGVKRRMGDLQGSHFDYRMALEFEPVFPLAYTNLGSVKILLGDYAGATEEFTHALEQDPELAMAWNNRGYAYFFLDDLESALSDFNAAIALDRGVSEASLNKSTLLAMQNKVEPALILLDEAIMGNPGSALLYLNRGLIRELMGDLKGACEDWGRANELGAADSAGYLKECNE